MAASATGKTTSFVVASPQLSYDATVRKFIWLSFGKDDGLG